MPGSRAGACYTQVCAGGLFLMKETKAASSACPPLARILCRENSPPGEARIHPRDAFPLQIPEETQVGSGPWGCLLRPITGAAARVGVHRHPLNCFFFFKKRQFSSTSHMASSQQTNTQIAPAPTQGRERGCSRHIPGTTLFPRLSDHPDPDRHVLTRRVSFLG